MTPHDPPEHVSRVAHLADKAWAVIGFPGRLAVIAFLTVFLGWAIVAVLRRLGRAARRSLLIGLTVVSFVGVVGLGSWSWRLPEPGGSYFVLWHQIVRVGAALSATGFVVGFIALTLPIGLNVLENWRFGSFIAVRHVRSQKSGFLTIISILSIAGVAVSSTGWR